MLVEAVQLKKTAKSLTEGRFKTESSEILTCVCHHHHWTSSSSFSAASSVMLNKHLPRKQHEPWGRVPSGYHLISCYLVHCSSSHTHTHTHPVVTCLGYSSLKCSSPTEAVMSPVKVLSECGNLLCSPSVCFFQCLLKRSEHHLT